MVLVPFVAQPQRKFKMTISFDEIRFPAAISRGASGGPERRTEIVTLASGGEGRNTRWANSRRRYNAGFGIRKNLFRIFCARIV